MVKVGPYNPVYVQLWEEKNQKKITDLSNFKLGAKWFHYRVSIHHPLGFNWHPFEGPGL